jgi:hypothetical protein
VRSEPHICDLDSSQYSYSSIRETQEEAATATATTMAKSAEETSAGNLASSTGWLARTQTMDEWLEMDLGNSTWVAGVVTKGVEVTGCWVTTFKV